LEITISGRHVEVTPTLKDYAQEQAEKLLRYFDGITRISVTLSLEAGRMSAEMVISVRKGLTIIGEVEDRDFVTALDILADKMERQLTRHKEKIKNHRGRKPLNEVATPPEGEDDLDDDFDDDDAFDEGEPQVE
jgi:putative sigma-54 modulation protein